MTKRKAASLTLGTMGVLGLTVSMTTGSLAAARGYDEVLIIPNELYDYVVEQGCSQVTDFYTEFNGSFDPPFLKNITGHIGLGNHIWDSFAVWCETDADQNAGKFERTFSLLLELPEGLQWPGGCQPRIDNEPRPGGIYVGTTQKILLENFYEIPFGEHLMAGDTMTDGPVLSSDWGGTGAHYYCHEGTWVKFTYD